MGREPKSSSVKGGMTLSIMILRRTAFIVKTLRITTFSVTSLRMKGLFEEHKSYSA